MSVRKRIGVLLAMVFAAVAVSAAPAAAATPAAAPDAHGVSPAFVIDVARFSSWDGCELAGFLAFGLHGQSWFCVANGDGTADLYVIF